MNYAIGLQTLDLRHNDIDNSDALEFLPNLDSNYNIKQFLSDGNKILEETNLKIKVNH